MVNLCFDPGALSSSLRSTRQPEPTRRPSAGELLRYPCLQSEMEKQLNDQKSKLNKERTQNEALKLEVSALIQKQSQRSGRLSRTITWDSKFEVVVRGKLLYKSSAPFFEGGD